MPTGGAWAAILAAAIGCAGFSLVSDFSEASKSIKRILSFYSPAGDLSGKSTLGVIIWLLAWAILHARWKNRQIQCPGRITVISGAILILLAMIMVFPPFVELFAAE